MLFPTIVFAVFFLLVLWLNWVLMPRPRAWKRFMLVASCVFYAYWDWRFVPLLLGSAVVNQAFANLIYRARSDRTRRRFLVGDIAFNLGLLGFFKYYGFFVTSVAAGLDRLGLHTSPPVLEIVLPVGISFFTFQAMSYTIDVYRGEMRPARRLLDFAVYQAFFPHLVAGPIVRARELLPQVVTPRRPEEVDVPRAVLLIVSGLAKKVVLASYLSSALADRVFDTPQAFGALDVVVGVLAYAVQIYCDFSAYTDIATGCALLLGFRFPLNFDAPYTARSLREFWRRWHMSLSSWLRDYLYIPLGGSRGSPSRTRRNLMLTMLLGGLWHGASWTFVVWGAIHGAVLAWEHGRPLPPEGIVNGRGVPRPPGAQPLALLRTFGFVCLAWVFFRSDSFSTAFRVLGRLVTGWAQAPTFSPLVLLAIAAGLASQFLDAHRAERAARFLADLHPVALGVAAALLVTGIDALGPPGVAPFIYFQF